MMVKGTSENPTYSTTISYQEKKQVSVPKQTYHSSPYQPALVKRSLLTSRGVDAVSINIPLLSLCDTVDLVAFLRGVLS